MKSFYLCTALICFAFTLTNCKKSGCTDTDAVNFNAKAKTKCCCEYDGKAVFYWTNKAYTELLGRKDSILTVEIGGSKFGPKKVTSFSSTNPGCGNALYLNATRRITSKSQQFIYSVKSQKDSIIWTGVVTLKGAECVAIELN